MSRGRRAAGWEWADDRRSMAELLGESAKRFRMPLGPFMAGDVLIEEGNVQKVTADETVVVLNVSVATDMTRGIREILLSTGWGVDRHTAWWPKGRETYNQSRSNPRRKRRR